LLEGLFSCQERRIARLVRPVCIFRRSDLARFIASGYKRGLTKYWTRASVSRYFSRHVRCAERTSSGETENNYMRLIVRNRRAVRRMVWRGSAGIVAILATASGTFAQGTSPWENAVNVLQTSFTGPIAKGLGLVAIVVGGLTFAFGEGGGKRTFAGIVFGLGMALLAVNFLSWLFGV
jgi:type IV secretion system protein TrbC